MQFNEANRVRRKPSLTPMIDVVFLLLVFFMLSSRFGLDQVLPMPLVSGGGDFSGAPKLVDVLPDGLRLNGVDQTTESLLNELHRLMGKPTETIILRSTNGADVQRIVLMTETLRNAGFTALVLVE